VLDGPVGKELDQDMEKAGFKVLAWATSWGYRNVITAKKEVKSAADLKGLKIRTIPTKVFVAAINSMGANATPMNFGEIYTSLQSGVLTAMSTPRDHHLVQDVRSGLLHGAHQAPHGPDLPRVLASRVEEAVGGEQAALQKAGDRGRQVCARWRRSAKARRSRRSRSSHEGQRDRHRAAGEGRSAGAGRPRQGVRRREAARADQKDP